MIRVDPLSTTAWETMSENAHKIAFGKVKPASLDRIDFALLAVDQESDRPLGYVTCREHDAETLYWQFGGALPGTRGTVNSWGTYLALIDWCSSRYRRLTTLIENKNVVMLKMAMKAGFLINGIRYSSDSILVELVKEF